MAISNGYKIYTCNTQYAPKEVAHFHSNSIIDTFIINHKKYIILAAY